MARPEIEPIVTYCSIHRAPKSELAVHTNYIIDSSDEVSVFPKCSGKWKIPFTIVINAPIIISIIDCHITQQVSTTFLLQTTPHEKNIEFKKKICT